MRISNRQKIRYIFKIDEFYCDINHVIDYKNIVVSDRPIILKSSVKAYSILIEGNIYNCEFI